MNTLDKDFEIRSYKDLRLKHIQPSTLRTRVRQLINCTTLNK